VPQFQVRELAFLRIGGESGEPVPVDVGEPQLRPGLRPLLADDDPHPGRLTSRDTTGSDATGPASSGCSRKTAMSARLSPPKATAAARSATIFPGS
jgi:hypothetical protein